MIHIATIHSHVDLSTVRHADKVGSSVTAAASVVTETVSLLATLDGALVGRGCFGRDVRTEAVAAARAFLFCPCVLPGEGLSALAVGLRGRVERRVGGRAPGMLNTVM